MAKVIAVCTSTRRGTQKENCRSAVFLENWGIEGDAHAGKWHRQVSLLSADKIDSFRKKAKTVCNSDNTKNGTTAGVLPDIPYGAFGENIVVKGIDFASLPIGTRFFCNDVVLELTQIGKECHNGCEIFKRMGDCIMPREGVFTRVVTGGKISEGDEMSYLLPFNVAVITISDSGAAGKRTDESGPTIKKILEQNGYPVVTTKIIPDEQKQIETVLSSLADNGIRQEATDDHSIIPIQLVFTTGGTGFSPRDVTPEATLAVTDRTVPGIPEAMRFYSLKITPRAMLSRAVAGIRKRTLIINLPGNPKACSECLFCILEPLVHALSILTDSAHNCYEDRLRAADSTGSKSTVTEPPHIIPV